MNTEVHTEKMAALFIEFVLIHFDKIMYDEGVEAEMRRLGLQPATYEMLKPFKQKVGELPYHVVALDMYLRKPGRYTDWNSGVRFLAYRVVVPA